MVRLGAEACLPTPSFVAKPFETGIRRCCSRVDATLVFERRLFLPPPPPRC